jgi:hypothetical protein
MTGAERERISFLVARIQEEKDHTKFLHLVEELNDLLDGKARRLGTDVGPTLGKPVSDDGELMAGTRGELPIDPKSGGNNETKK